MPTTTALMIDAGNSWGREFSMILASNPSNCVIFRAVNHCVRLNKGGQPVVEVVGSLALEKWDAGIANWAAWASRTMCVETS